MYKLLLVIVLLSSTLFANKIVWEKDFHSGVVKAKKLNKPILFVVSNHSCRYCVKLEKTTFSDKRVIKTLNKDFVSIISYSDENDYTPRELLRSATPTSWFLKADGSPMFQALIGTVGTEKFLKYLSVVKKEFKKVNNKKRAKKQ
ncbi:MAG: thioredoxin [Sulfurimonas sp.]|nr:MAG: thioredoxin [Sulfurimonas sp.]